VVHDKGKAEKEFRSLKAEDDVLIVGLERALELLAQPKRGRGGRTALRELGTPEGSEELVQVFNGPYGLYVKQGKVNASLPEGKGAEEITLVEALELLAAKAATTKGSRKAAAGSKAKAAKSTVAKAKTTKAPAAKTPAAKTSARSGRPRAGAVRIIKAASS
jgi:DNA topoisomerase-1